MKVLRCQSETELEDQIKFYKSKGWYRVGHADVFDGMYVQTIKINLEIDDTEEITRPCRPHDEV